LITLLEEDKRLGAAFEIKVRLPYSRDSFGLPPNLYVIGTMNTADRSVEALDAALRRRFFFIPCLPKVELLPDERVGDLEVDLRRMLTVMNARLERLLDRDHCLGHSYFLGVSKAENPLDALRQAFANKVLPLLEEYFYGDIGKIGLVLGAAFIRKRTTPERFAACGWEADEDEDRASFERTDPMTLDVGAFQAIYA
jgi:5-methylcytosine-specific restriction protein B